MQTPMSATTNPLFVSKMLCVPTERVYQDMYQRSFALGMSPNEAVNVSDFFNTQGVGNNATLSMPAVAKHMSGVVGLAAAPNSKVLIPHGWDTQRLMYLLAVDEVVSDSCTMTHYLQGYSEYHDPSLTGRIDPNMNFFINSIITVIRTRNPYTNLLDTRVHEAYNVITDTKGGYTYEAADVPGAGVDLIRPADILTNLYSDSLYSDMGVSNVNVSTTSMGNGANTSKKSNNDPLKYFTNTVNAVITGKSTDHGYGTTESVLAAANAVVEENTIGNNGFIYELVRRTGIMEPNSFTLAVLEQIDPSVSSKVTMAASGSLLNDPTVYNTVLDTNDTESMLNYTVESDVAQIFINAVSGVMSENMITVLSGTITNQFGTPVTTISNIQSFLEGVDITPYGNRIINYIDAVIVPQISYNNLRMIDIVFECDLIGDTVVSISVDGGIAVPYRLPTFADSLYSPVIADKGVKDAIVDDFSTVVDTVISAGQNIY